MLSRAKVGWRATRDVVSESAREASADNVPMMAAAISYYLLVTLAPLALALAVFATAVRAAAGLAYTTTTPSPWQDVLAGYSTGTNQVVALVALGVLLFGASGVFSQFALAILRIWKEPAQRGPLFSFARRHLIAFLLLLVLALGLIASLLVTTALSTITDQFAELARSVGVDVAFLETVGDGSFAYNFVAAFLLFTVAFSVVPARKLRAREVAPGAGITAAAFAVGQIGLTYYLGHTSRVDLYGNLSALIVVMLWAYYSSMIALYGAELTKAIVLRRERARTAV